MNEKHANLDKFSFDFLNNVDFFKYFANERHKRLGEQI
jgi:hypothetical protein